MPNSVIDRMGSSQAHLLPEDTPENKTQRTLEIMKKVAIIGLDTSHAVALPKLMQDPETPAENRVSELLALKLKDVNVQARIVTVARGKGAKQRSVPITEFALEYLQTYIEHYRSHNKGKARQEIFLNRRGEPLSRVYFFKQVQRAFVLYLWYQVKNLIFPFPFYSE